MLEPGKINIVPVVIGELGSACDSLTAHLEANFNDALEIIVHRTALLGNIHYLKNSLY